MTRVIAFDVNETLLDLSALDEVFTEVFGDASLRKPWFAQTLQLGFVGGLTGHYLNFSAAQRAALEMVSAQAGTPVSDRQADLVAERTRSLPAHPDVADALARLADSPLRAVALTNSVLDVVQEQLERADLRRHLDGVYSVDSVRALKPAPAAYQHVAEQCGVDVGEVRLVAVHPWDVSGALAAGCRAALVTRSGAVPSPVGPQPDVVEADLGAVVDRVLELDA